MKALRKERMGLIHAYQQGVGRVQSLEEDNRKLEAKMGGLNAEIERLKERE